MQCSFPKEIFFPYAFVFTFVVYFWGLFLWWVKARFFLADEPFLKMDKYLRKYGVWALLNLSYGFFMAATIVYGCLVLFLHLHCFP